MEECAIARTLNVQNTTTGGATPTAELTPTTLSSRCQRHSQQKQRTRPNVQIAPAVRLQVHLSPEDMAMVRATTAARIACAILALTKYGDGGHECVFALFDQKHQSSNNPIKT